MKNKKLVAAIVIVFLILLSILTAWIIVYNLNRIRYEWYVQDLGRYVTLPNGKHRFKF